ncbi:hypothetical protein QUB75_24965 [Microcoleus sp. K1-B6]|uniref:hypothetical protein n=1 Tax=unclassified Microcoleus TaxID=2642155 RepID=UPI002FD046F2
MVDRQCESVCLDDRTLLLNRKLLIVLIFNASLKNINFIAVFNPDIHQFSHYPISHLKSKKL